MTLLAGALCACGMIRKDLAANGQAWNHLRPEHKEILKRWKESQRYRPALEIDCGYCKEAINSVRHGNDGWYATPSFHPYYTIGDFNSDDHEDFALALVDLTKERSRFVLVVFNGPAKSGSKVEPAFIARNLELQGAALFYGPPRPKPYRLLVGPFDSEGELLQPNGSSYKWSESQEGDTQ